MPTQGWICDTCGGQISAPEHGWVEWINVPAGMKHKVRGMRLVHHAPASPKRPDQNCQYDEQEEFAKDRGTVGDRSLRRYLGPDGLMEFLEHMADPAFKNVDIAEMCKRVQIPGYDLAKGYFEKAIGESVIELNCPRGFYSQQQIQGVIDEYELG